jgi:hypothetical protein
MSKDRSFFLTLHRPLWQEQLPPRLRLALEWQFGTFLLGAVVLVFRGQFALAGLLVLLSIFLFAFLAGWVESRRINSPYLWWPFAILVTLMGFGLLIGSIFGDVS